MGGEDRFGLVEMIEDVIGAASIILTIWAGCFLAGGLGGIAGVAPWHHPGDCARCRRAKDRRRNHHHRKRL